MNLRTLYVSKLAKCPLTCLADLAGDPSLCQYGWLARSHKEKKRKRIVISLNDSDNDSDSSSEGHNNDKETGIAPHKQKKQQTNRTVNRNMKIAI